MSDIPLHRPTTYGKIRDFFFKQSAKAPPPPAPPPRPPGLDTRLPAKTADRIRALLADRIANASELLRLEFELVESIDAELRAIDPRHHWYHMLSPGRRAIILLSNLEREVNNGGTDQFYLNSSGDGAAATPESLRLLGLDELATWVQTGNNQFPAGPPTYRPTRLQQMERLPANARNVWDELSHTYFDIESGAGGFLSNAGMSYVLAHESEFFLPR